MYEWFRNSGFKSPDDHFNNPYCFAHQTGDKNMWEYIGSFPDRFESLNLAMIAQTEATKWTAGVFPFTEELSKLQTDDETVLVVDIGGGSGHVTKKIKEFADGIPGQIVLQERPEVIESIGDKLPDIKKMEYDFFTPQPLKGNVFKKNPSSTS
jgi:hypothetical protein